MTRFLDWLIPRQIAPSLTDELALAAEHIWLLVWAMDDVLRRAQESIDSLLEIIGCSKPVAPRVD